MDLEYRLEIEVPVRIRVRQGRETAGRCGAANQKGAANDGGRTNRFLQSVHVR